MASVTEKPQSTPQPTPPPQAVVDQQIQRTRRTLKSVDATVGLLMLAIGVLAFLLTAAVLDHWVLPGGWSPAMRTTLFALLVLGIAWYSLRVLWPLARLPINPAYAAQAIEQSSPSLKNSLLNLLLLRGQRRQILPQVYLAIEAQAAQRLANVPTDTAVDRSAILRLGYVLVAMVALCTLYRIVSPKDPLASAARVLLPWSEIAAPSRVQILDVAPGSTSLARGEQLPVSVEVLGLGEDEPVRLFFTTADQQKVDQIIQMTPAASRTHFECRLVDRQSTGKIAAAPAGGVQQDLTYWIEAGDARSPRYRVSVFARPTLVVTGVRYEYPDYTGYPTRDVEHTGDLRAIEGSLVTLVAQASKPIDTAHVDFEADGKRDLLMKSADRQATVTFPLTLKDDRRTPRYQTYVLRYLTTLGRKNLAPPKYQIDVIPDYSPEVQLLLPEEALIDVKIDAPVEFRLEARDPDFAVQEVTLFGEVGGEPILQQKLLAKNHTGRFVGRFRKTPAELGLQVGDVMDYWAAATDNRRPTANVAQTVRRRLRVVGEQQGATDNQQDGEPRDRGGDQPGGDQGDGAGGGTGAAGEATDGGQGPSGAGANGHAEGGQSDPQEGGQPGGETAAEQEGAAGESQAGEGGSAANPPRASARNSEDGNPGGRSGDRESENQGNQEKVSAEGDDDGAAFDRMAEHFREQDQSGDSPDANDREQIGAGTAGSETSDGGRGDNGGDTPPHRDPAGESSPVDDDFPANESGGAAQGDVSAGDSGGERQHAEGSETEDGQAEDGQAEDGQEANEQEEGGSESAPGEKGSPQQGPAGAGENPGQDQQGIPDPEGHKKPRDKTPDPAARGQQPGQEPAADSTSESESDADSSQGGDRSGEGSEGAGQRADAEGTGGSGEHQAAEEGGGKAPEPGEGEAGSQPGDGKPSRGKTGNSNGNQPGGGTKSGDPQGDSPQGEGDPAGDNGGDNGDDNRGRPDPAQQGQQGQEDQDHQRPEGQPSSDRASNSPTDGQAPPQSGEPSQGEVGPAADGPPGGGQGGDGSQPPAGDILPGDEANLEYARQQTDLVLERIEDQLDKRQVDEALLDKLGWSQDELRRFVDRWKNLKSKATEDNPSDAAKKELDESLRRLGLLPKGRLGYRSRAAKDRLRDLREAYRGRTPLEYQDRLRAYVKGTARGDE